MPEIADALAAAGLPYPLADELERTSKGGTTSAVTLSGLGVPGPLAIELSAQIASKTANVPALMALGIPPQAAAYIGAGIIPGGGGAGGAVDVLFIFGQSNSVILGATAPPASVQGQMSDVFIWQPWAGTFATYEAASNSDALYSDPPTITATARTAPMGFGAEANFARLWKRDRPGVPLYIVKVGKPSSALQEAARTNTIGIWDPTKAGEFFAYAKAQRDAAYAALAAAGKTPRVVGLFWMQGENDAQSQTAAPTYLTALRTLRDRMRSDIMGGGTAPFVIGRVANLSVLPYRADVRAAQETVGGEAGCRWFSTDAYAVQGDGIHFTANAAPVQGADLYRAVFPSSGLYTDDFATALEYLEYSDKWERIDGVVGAARPTGGALTCVQADSTGTTYRAPDLGSANHAVQGKLTAASINGLLARLTDRDNHLILRSHTGSAPGYQVIARVAGANSVIGTYGSAPVVGDIMRLEASGTTFAVKINGVQVGTGAIPAGLTSTRTGIMARTAAGICDDFRSEAL